MAKYNFYNFRSIIEHMADIKGAVQIPYYV